MSSPEINNIHGPPRCLPPLLGFIFSDSSEDRFEINQCAKADGQAFRTQPTVTLLVFAPLSFAA